MSGAGKNTTVEFEFDRPVSVDNVEIGPGGSVHMFSGGVRLKPKRVVFASHRERSNGREKSLFSIPTSEETALTGEVETLSRFARIFVVDTNTVSGAYEPVSFGSIAVVKVETNLGSGKAVVTTAYVGGFEFHGLADRQERLSWALLQDAIRGSADYRQDGEYLIVTDHDKRRHGAICGRQEPLFGDSFLAPNISMAFATSDSGQSVLQNIIRNCDRMSARFLRDLCAGKVEDTNQRVFTSGPISKFRIVVNSVENWSSTPHENFRLSMDMPILESLEGD